MKKRFGLALLAGAAMLGAGAAEAQVAGFAPYREDPGSALTRHLKSLSDNPRSLHALMGAGEAALQLGDPQAAVTFFARAEEIAPRDGRIKAGMGAAFVQMEQAQSALRFFGDAGALGVSEAEFAGDRGLAYDLIGDNKQAQRDYRLALGRKKDPEVERRLALSLAISGDKAGAMQAIADQLARQDRAAWRTRAFVLALTGDAAGATQAVQAVMPAQASAMQPFLARLSSLDAASQAMAVHFGHFPGGGRPVQMAQAAPFLGPPAPVATQPARPDTGQAAVGVRTEPAAAAARRRPDAAGTIAAGAPSAAATKPGAAPTNERVAAARRQRSTSSMTLAERMVENRARWEEAARAAKSAPPAARTPPPAEQKPAQLALGGAAPAAAGSPPPAASVPGPAVTPAPAPVGETKPPALAQAAAAPPAERPVTSSSPDYVPPTLEPFGPPAFDASAPQRTAPAPAATESPAAPGGSAPATAIQTAALPESLVQTPPPAPPPAPEAQAPQAAAPEPSAPTPAAPAPRKPLAFAEVVEAVRALPDTARAGSKSAGQAEAKPVKLASEEKAVQPSRSKPQPSAKAGGDAAGRHWVQIASAPDGLVTSEYRRLKRKHAGLLGDKEGYRAPMGKSNRVLVGPFASAGEARDFVGQLKKNSLTAIAWTSADGQEIEKLPAK